MALHDGRFQLGRSSQLHPFSYDCGQAELPLARAPPAQEVGSARAMTIPHHLHCFIAIGYRPYLKVAYLHQPARFRLFIDRAFTPVTEEMPLPRRRR